MDTTVADLQAAWDKLETWFRSQRERVSIDSVLVQSHLALPGQARKLRSAMPSILPYLILLVFLQFQHS
jgi:hypothetical protein